MTQWTDLPHSCHCIPILLDENTPGAGQFRNQRQVPASKIGVQLPQASQLRERMGSEWAMILPVTMGETMGQLFGKHKNLNVAQPQPSPCIPPENTWRLWQRRIFLRPFFDSFLVMIRCIALFCTWVRGSYHSGRNHQKDRNSTPRNRSKKLKSRQPGNDEGNLEPPSWKYVYIFLGLTM